MAHTPEYPHSHLENGSVLSEDTPTPSVSECSPHASKNRFSIASTRSSVCSAPTVAPTPRSASSDTLVAYDAHKPLALQSTSRLLLAHAGYVLARTFPARIASRFPRVPPAGR